MFLMLSFRLSFLGIIVSILMLLEMWVWVLGFFGLVNGLGNLKLILVREKFLMKLLNDFLGKLIGIVIFLIMFLI